MLAAMVSNFDKGVRGVVPALDYKHEPTTWPQDGSRSIRCQQPELYRDRDDPKEKFYQTKSSGYISAEFDDQYTDNETGQKHGCALGAKFH